jgi:hypothetical protein
MMTSGLHVTIASTLDLAQATAVANLNALNLHLALIQGPPGTGKGSTGIAVIKILLKNRRGTNSGPTLLSCCTNHALDQMLEHLHRAEMSQIIRIGGQCKSELLASANLREVLDRSPGFTKAESGICRRLKGGIAVLERELSSTIQRVRDTASWTAIRNHLRFHHRRHLQSLTGTNDEESSMAKGIQSYAIRKEIR